MIDRYRDLIVALEERLHIAEEDADRLYAAGIPPLSKAATEAWLGHQDALMARFR